MPNLVAGWTCPLCDRINPETIPYCFGCGRPRNLPANPQDYQQVNWPIQSSGANYVPPYFVNPFDLWYPQKEEKPKPVPKPAGIKCTSCTRLIEQREGRWQRIHSSKSDKTRPDYVCIKSKDGRHHAPMHVTLENLKGAVESFQEPVKKATKSLSELYDAATQGIYKPLSSVMEIAGKVIPREPWSYCQECGQFIYLDNGGLWRDKGVASLSGLCAGNGDVLHKPSRECAYCLAPAEHCEHVHYYEHAVTEMRRLDISRSQWTPDRWLVTGCCPACWQGDLLGDLEDHCGLCPCCDTDGVSRKGWTDNMGVTYNSPLEVPRSGPACPFPYARKLSVELSVEWAE